MEFVSNLKEVSFESSMKWTINNWSKISLLKNYVIKSKKVLFGEANASWHMQVQQHIERNHEHYLGLPYLHVKFFLNDSGNDANANFRFTAKIAGHVGTTNVRNIDNEPIVMKAEINRNFYFDDSKSVDIVVTCKMETLRYEFLVLEPKKIESVNSENEFEKLSMSEMESVEAEIHEGSDDEQSLLSAIDTEEIETDPVEYEVSIAEESLLSAIDRADQEEIEAALTTFTAHVAELKNKLEIAEQIVEIHKSCPRPKSPINPVIERPGSNSSGSGSNSFIPKSSDTEDIETDDDDEEGGKLFGMSPMALTKRIRKVYMVKFRENADTSARMLVTAFRVGSASKIENKKCN